MRASSFFTRPKPTALPAKALYCWAKPTWLVAWVTTGKNFSPSGARVLLEKNCVTEVSPPVRMFLASVTLMLCTAPISRSLPIGTAASAARLSEVSSSSMRLPWPKRFIIWAASFR